MDQKTDNHNKNIEKINSEFQKTMKKAFYDLIIEKTSSEKPDFDWLVNLYCEIREGLIKILKKGSPLRNEIEESLDIELFSQMIRNNAFNGEDMYKLTNYTFEKLLQLGSAVRDKEVETKRDEIFTLMQNKEVTFGKIVGLYLKNAHICLDLLHLDLQNLKANLENIKNKK